MALHLGLRARPENHHAGLLDLLPFLPEVPVTIKANKCQKGRRFQSCGCQCLPRRLERPGEVPAGPMADSIDVATDVSIYGWSEGSKGSLIVEEDVHQGLVLLADMVARILHGQTMHLREYSHDVVAFEALGLFHVVRVDILLA